MHDSLTDKDAGVSVVRSGISRGHFIAGLIYGVAACKRAELSPAKQATYDSVWKHLVPQMTDPAKWNSELAMQFGKGSNTTDFIKGYITGGEESQKVVSETYSIVVESLAKAGSAQYAFMVRGDQKFFKVAQIFSKYDISGTRGDF